MTLIAFACTNTTATWGGSEELWSQTAAMLLNKHTEVRTNVVGWTTWPKQLQNLHASGCVVTVSRQNTIYAKVLRRLKLHHDFAWLDQTRPDLVVISQGGFLDGVSWMLACAERRIPFVTIAQCASDFHWPSDAEAGIARRAYASALMSYFVSEANLNLVRDQVGFEFPNAEVVRNPFQVSYHSKPTWPDTNDGFRLACVGRLMAQHKGQDLLIRTLSAYKWRERPISVSLIGAGPNLDILRIMIDRYNAPNVAISGFSSNIEDVWKTHHGLILPSRHEGLPLAVVEAMLQARVPIVTAIAGNPEVIEDNVTGFLAAAPTVEHLDEALERAWAKRDQWREMGLAAARSIRETVPQDPIIAFADKLLAKARGIAQ